MTTYMTLSAINQFRFVCPIFNVETQFRACSKLRDLVYVGKAPPVRIGCQACIKSNKCPASNIITKMIYAHGEAPDEYGSDTPVLGKLRQNVLERIAPVIVLEVTMNQMGVPDAERALIATASERIYKQLGTAPVAAEKGYRPKRGAQRDISAPKPSAPTGSVNKAAATGDLAAAISE